MPRRESHGDCRSIGFAVDITLRDAQRLTHPIEIFGGHRCAEIIEVGAEPSRRIPAGQIHRPTLREVIFGIVGHRGDVGFEDFGCEFWTQLRLRTAGAALIAEGQELRTRSSTLGVGIDNSVYPDHSPIALIGLGFRNEGQSRCQQPSPRGLSFLPSQTFTRAPTTFAMCWGFRVLWEEAPDWRLVERDGVRVMLGHCPRDLRPSEIGSHNWFGYLNVEDVAALHDELTARGAACTPPSDAAYGSERSSSRQ